MDWLIFTGAIALLFSPLFAGIAFDETDPKGSVMAAACAIGCASLLPILMAFV